MIGIVAAHMNFTVRISRGPAKRDPFRRLCIHVLGKSFAPPLFTFGTAHNVPALIPLQMPVYVFVHEERFPDPGLPVSSPEMRHSITHVAVW